MIVNAAVITQPDGNPAGAKIKVVQVFWTCGWNCAFLNKRTKHMKTLPCLRCSACFSKVLRQKGGASAANPVDNGPMVHREGSAKQPDRAACGSAATPSETGW
jgi:hypothetical protein